MRRRTKEEASADLRMLAVVNRAFSATQSKKGGTAYQRLARSLKAIVDSVPLENQDQAANQKKVAGALVKLGALFQKN